MSGLAGKIITFKVENASNELEISTDKCRLCLTKSNILKSMFHCSIGPQSYAEIYESCFNFSVQDMEDLPTRICINCELKLIEFHSFRQSILDIEDKILSFLSKFDEKNCDNDDQVEILEEQNDEEDYVETYEVVQEEFLMEADDVDTSKPIQTEEATEITVQVVDTPAIKDTRCKFSRSSTDEKKVSCRTCTSCALEWEINDESPSKNITILCECNKAFKNRRSFIKHYTTIHERKELNFLCRVCNEVFSSVRPRAAHEAKVHNYGLKYSCETCEKKFYRSDHLKEHVKNCIKVFDVSSRFLTCDICQLKFQREDSYRRHLDTAHGASGAELTVELLKSHPKKRTSSDEPSVACEQCKKTFKNYICLKRHVAIFHSEQNQRCELCDEVFVHRSTKASHMSKVHGARRPFECSVEGCGLSFFKRDRFTAHMEKHENPDKKFPCPICLQEFNSYNMMTLHRAKHIDKGAMECPTCSKQFLDKRNFQLHLKLHTGEDLFRCSVCTKGFNRKDHLKKHVDRKHPELGQETISEN